MVAMAYIPIIQLSFTKSQAGWLLPTLFGQEYILRNARSNEDRQERVEPNDRRNSETPGLRLHRQIRQNAYRRLF